MAEQGHHGSLDQNKDAQIAAVLVVGFHHAYGPILEFCHPPLPQRQGQDPQTKLEKIELPEEWSFLPFLALPDGAHQMDEDFAYFHLPPVAGWEVAETTLFGISCNRQIATKDLLVKSADVTRSIVQKAVVVLARQPIFGPIRQKLAIITGAWFNEKDFTKLDILYNFYDNLNSTHIGPIDDPTLYMGTSLRELFQKFRSKTLTLIKLLLLEKRILFYGYPVERLCTFQYSLISLIPGLLRSLQDSGDPSLDTTAEQLEVTEAKILSNGNKASLLRYMGLPLHLFEKGSFFQPYLPLQQIDMLSDKGTNSYLVGTTNQLFFHQKTEINIDVLVHVDNGTLEFFDPQLASIVHHTMADRRWMDKLTKVINTTWDPAGDPTRPIQNTYLGSDDYLRARFEEYIMSLLSSVKYAQAFDPKNAFRSESTMEEIMRDEEKEKNYLLDYGMNWVNAWRETNSYKLWDEYTDHEIYEIVEPGYLFCKLLRNL
ncbi:AVL9/DENND6 domain-containing protein [Umbelopsis sp. PMI_123]|nr:AVL9/DENND6 domain-containing protein [Umbelopsis sp. PMI_123]